MSDSEDAESPIFAATTSTRLAEAGADLVEALREYVAAAAAVTDVESRAALEPSSDHVMALADLFDAAHYAHLKEFAPLGEADLDALFEDGSVVASEEEEQRVVDAIEAGSVVSVVTRQDFVVTDPAAVLAAAGAAWAETYDRPATAKDLPTIGHALSELLHHGGRDVLDDQPGILPTATVTIFRRPEQLLNGSRLEEAEGAQDAYEGFAALLAEGGEIGFAFTEQWG